MDQARKKVLPPVFKISDFKSTKWISQEKIKWQEAVVEGLENAPMEGVTFELGWLCGTLTVAQFSEKLILMMENGYDFNQTTSYIARLPFRVKSIPFEDLKESSRASILIYNRIKRPIDK